MLDGDEWKMRDGAYEVSKRAVLSITSPHGSVVERITSNDEVVSSILAVGIIAFFLRFFVLVSETKISSFVLRLSRGNIVGGFAPHVVC